MGNRFYVTGGTVPRDAACYIARNADEELVAALRQGDYCYVLTSRQMGKSSLMVRAAITLRQQGATCVVLDLTAVGQNVTAEQWYGGLLAQLGRQTGLEDEADDFWFKPSPLGPLQRWMLFLRDTVLPHCTGKLVIFIDEIDAVRSLPFSADEFFAGIRECYNRRSEDPVFIRLTFCLLGVATPSDLIHDTRTTPFNIGRRITLTDFTPQEAQPLTNGFPPESAGPAAILLNRVLHWTGGHPYLTQRLCQAIAEQGPKVRDSRDVDALCEEMFFSSGARERDDNLLFVRERLLRSDADLASLLNLYQRVLTRQRVVNDEADPLTDQLHLSGIVRVIGDRLAVRNLIYQRVFDQHWLQSNLPDIAVRRERAAFRRGVFRTLSIGGAVLLVMAALAWFAFSQADLAQKNATKAAQNAATATRNANKEAKARQDAEASATLAKNETLRANKQTRIAQEQTEKAKRKAEAEKRARNRADRANQEARLAKIKADQKAREAADNLNLANKRLQEVEKANGRTVSALAEAKKNALLASHRAEEAERSSYTAAMNLIPLEWERNNVIHVQALLKETERYVGRGFEWGYWNRLCHLELRTIDAPQPLWCGALSSDGTRVLTASPVNGNSFWNLQTGERVYKSVRPQRPVTVAASSPDGKVFATGSIAGFLQLWDAGDGKLLLNIQAAKSDIADLSFSPDGNYLLVTSGGEGIQLLDARTGKVVRTFQAAVGQVVVAVFSPDGKYIVSTAGYRNASGLYAKDGQWLAGILWDMESGKQIRQFQSRTIVEAECLSISPDGTVIAIGSANHSVTLWDTKSGQELRRLIAHTDRLTAVRFSPDSKRVATASVDATACLWDTETGQLLCTFRGHTKEISWLSFTPDGKRLVTTSYDTTVKVWNVSPDADAITLYGGKPAFWTSAPPPSLTPNGRGIVTESDDAIAKIWDTETGASLSALIGHQKRVTMAVFSPDGTKVLTASADNTAKIWESATGQCLQTLQGHKDPVTWVAFSPDGSRCATASADTNQVWETHNGNRLLELRLPGPRQGMIPDGTFDQENVRQTTPGSNYLMYPRNYTAFSPNGRYILTTNLSFLVVWDAQTGAKRLAGNYSPDFPIVFSPDSKRLVFGTSRAAIHVMDIESGQEIKKFGHQMTEVTALTFSPDGTLIITAGSDLKVHIWDSQTFQEKMVLVGHTQKPRSVAFSPDGTRIVTGGDDDSVRLWDAKTGKQLLMFRANPQTKGAKLFRVFFSATGQRLIVKNNDLPVKIFSAEFPKPN